jgi:hypothetical protein
MGVCLLAPFDRSEVQRAKLHLLLQLGEVSAGRLADEPVLAAELHVGSGLTADDLIGCEQALIRQLAEPDRYSSNLPSPQSPSERQRPRAVAFSRPDSNPSAKFTTLG